MIYYLGIERVEPDKFLAWVLNLTGCFARGTTREEAIAAAPRAIADFFNWRDGYTRVADSQIDLIQAEVTETFENYETIDGYWVNSFFETDRRTLSAVDVDDLRWLISLSRADLMQAIQRAAPARLSAAIDGEKFGSITGILSHVAGAELWYLDKLGLGFSRADLPDDPLRQLEKVRAHTIVMLPRLADNDTINEVRGELWSARKVARRIVWHERVHTWHIERLLVQPQPAGR